MCSRGRREDCRTRVDTETHMCNAQVKVSPFMDVHVQCKCIHFWIILNERHCRTEDGRLRADQRIQRQFWMTAGLSQLDFTGGRIGRQET